MKSRNICILYCIITTFIIPISAVEDEYGTDITLGIVEGRDFDNTHILIETENDMPLKDAIIFMKNNSGQYLPIGKSDAHGYCNLYLIEGQTYDFMIERNGFKGEEVSIKRNKQQEQNVIIHMHRTSDYKNITFDDVAIDGIELNDLVFINDKITFSLKNTNMDDMHPQQGDIRFRPLYWYVEPYKNNKMKMSKAISNAHKYEFKDEKGTIQINKEGRYILYVVFQKEMFTQTTWLKEDGLYTKQKTFDVKNPVKNPDQPIVRPDNPNLIIEHIQKQPFKTRYSSQSSSFMYNNHLLAQEKKDKSDKEKKNIPKDVQGQKNKNDKVQTINVISKEITDLHKIYMFVFCILGILLGGCIYIRYRKRHESK